MASRRRSFDPSSTPARVAWSPASDASVASTPANWRYQQLHSASRTPRRNSASRRLSSGGKTQGLPTPAARKENSSPHQAPPSSGKAPQQVQREWLANFPLSPDTPFASPPPEARAAAAAVSHALQEAVAAADPPPFEERPPPVETPASPRTPLGARRPPPAAHAATAPPKYIAKQAEAVMVDLAELVLSPVTPGAAAAREAAQEAAAATPSCDERDGDGVNEDDFSNWYRAMDDGTAVRRAAFPGTPYPPNTVEVVEERVDAVVRPPVERGASAV